GERYLLGGGYGKQDSGEGRCRPSRRVSPAFLFRSDVHEGCKAIRPGLEKVSVWAGDRFSSPALSYLKTLTLSSPGSCAGCFLSQTQHRMDRNWIAKHQYRTSCTGRN